MQLQLFAVQLEGSLLIVSGAVLFITRDWFAVTRVF